jgi:hypothetical protein
MEAKRQTHIIQSGALYFSEEDLFLENRIGRCPGGEGLAKQFRLTGKGLSCCIFPTKISLDLKRIGYRVLQHSSVSNLAWNAAPMKRCSPFVGTPNSVGNLDRHIEMGIVSPGQPMNHADCHVKFQNGS